MKHKPIQKFDLFFFITILVMILFLAWSARAQGASQKQMPENFLSTAGTLTLKKNVIADVAASGASQTAPH